MMKTKITPLYERFFHEGAQYHERQDLAYAEKRDMADEIK